MCFHTFRGHTAEIVSVAFNPLSTLVATGSMDTTAKIWSVKTGEELHTLAVSCARAEHLYNMGVAQYCTDG